MYILFCLKFKTKNSILFEITHKNTDTCQNLSVYVVFVISSPVCTKFCVFAKHEGDYPHIYVYNTIKEYLATILNMFITRRLAV